MEGRSIAMMCVSLLLTACAPQEEPAGPDWAEQQPGGNLGRDEVLALVKASTLGESEQSAENWVNTLMAEAEGQVMFPRWVVSRKGSQKYEVLFTYTLLRDDYGIEKKGCRWTVNAVLKLVSPAVEMSQEDFDRLPGARRQQQRSEQTWELLNLE